jgi:hypothetical protein
VKLRYGEIHVGDFDDRDHFARWCREKCEGLWALVEKPDADPPPLVLMHLYDPIGQEAVTHIHAPEPAWFMNMSRRHELAERIGMMADLAPIRHVAWMLSAVELRHEGPQEEFDRHHDEILAMYGTLTKAWQAGVENVGEIAQVAVASVDGATAWSAAVIRRDGQPPTLTDWKEANAGSTDGPLIDPIQEALDAS